MDGHRHNAPLNDSSLDREIESLLAVEPSPEFVARVRARVASEPEATMWRPSWMFAMAGAAAIVIVAVLVWPSRERVPSIVAPLQRTQVADIGEPPIAVPESVPAVRRSTHSSVASLVATASSRTDIDLPAVIVAENEATAFAALVVSLRQSRFDVAVPAALNPDTLLEVKELPPVEPIEIEPIVRLAALQAEGERP